MKSRGFSVIVATDLANGIGKENTIPWYLPPDMAFFKQMTRVSSGQRPHLVLMGRRTWESLPVEYRPLPGRVNCVLSRDSQLSVPKGVLVEHSMDSALEHAFIMQDNRDVDQIFIIGGRALYVAALERSDCHTIYRTLIHDTFDCSVFFPMIDARYCLEDESDMLDYNGLSYQFQRYRRG